MKRIICLFLLHVGLIFSEEAGISKSLHLENLIQEVLKRNPDLSATKERIKAAEFFQKRVQILEDPEFIVMRHDQPFGSASNSPFRPKARYSVFQQIPFPGKLSLKGKIEGQQVAFLKSENIATKQDLILESKKLFYQLYYYDMAIKINEFNRNIISEFVQTTFALYRSGEDSFSEAVKAQVELQRLDDEKLKLIATRDRLLSLINAILNRDAYEPLGSPQAFFHSSLVFDHLDLEHKSFQYNPELLGIESRISEQHFRRDLAKREYFPDFIVGSRFEHILGSNDTAWGVSVGINVPIWIPWKQRRDVQRANALTASYEDELQAMKAAIKGRIRKILAEVNSLEERIFLLESGILPKTWESFESGKAEYQAGRGDFLTLLDTIRLYYQYQLEFEQTRVEKEISLAELERTVGIKLGE
ncbi:MAG: TolC family protein [Simkaniaceae bacterium]